MSDSSYKLSSDEENPSRGMAHQSSPTPSPPSIKEGLSDASPSWDGAVESDPDTQEQGQGLDPPFHVASDELELDLDRPGTSGMGPSSKPSWDPSQAGPSTSGVSGRELLRGADTDRSQTTSPSLDSSLGESRSPDVLWRDSCVSDMSESSPDSANCSTSSPKDESNGSGMNGHSSSGMNSDQEKQSKATFDKVLIDANQRRQIRNKVRNTGTDSGSDSSSSNMHMATPAPISTSSGSGLKLASTLSESSGIGANYMSSVQCDLTLPHSKLMQGNVTNSSTGVSTMYNSQGNKLSEDSKQDTVSSGSSGSRKRHIPWSIARYYYQTKRPNLASETAELENEAGIEMGSVLNKRPTQTDRKRKRFHRTFTALRQCGLLNLTMQTAALMEQNTKLQKQLGDLHRQAHLMYHTVSHFSKIQPTAFDSPEAQQVMEGLKVMVDKNPMGELDMMTFGATTRDSPVVDSGEFTLSSTPHMFLKSLEPGASSLNIPGSTSRSHDLIGGATTSGSTDSAIQSATRTTSCSSDKSGL